MSETFAQYLKKWLEQSTVQGLNNPLVKMPIKRFRVLPSEEFSSIANGGLLTIGTMAEPIARNLYRNYQTRIRERGEHCAFICYGAVEMTIAGGVGQPNRVALFPVCLKRASLQTAGDLIKVKIEDDEPWRFNPVLEAHLKEFGINKIPGSMATNYSQATNWVKAQLGNRASVKLDSYIGLFSSQQMRVQERLTEPLLRQALAKNPVIRAKLEEIKIEAVDLGETTDDGLEELGLILPCDDSQLRVIQLSDKGFCLQVEGPPGTGKSQTIANIISNALYHGRNALLVCDKKAAIVQVEERLTNCGLKPTLLNLHDEDLDKQEFLRQATDKFQSRFEMPGVNVVGRRTSSPANYPFDQLKKTRETLNERVRFAREIAHPSLQIKRREALDGLIRLKKELKDVPTIQIPNWQSISKERFIKLLSSIAEWPELVNVLTDNKSIWNRVQVETFENNPNAEREIQELTENIINQVESLDELREWAATIGLENPLNSDSAIADALRLIEVVLAKPVCHPQIVGNKEVNLSELERLQKEWEKEEKLKAARHPVSLTEVYPVEAKQKAEALLLDESATTWNDLSQKEVFYNRQIIEIENSQIHYWKLCGQLGLVYSPLRKVRRAQLQAVIALGRFSSVIIPRIWWNSQTKPGLTVNGWMTKLKACSNQIKNAPVPVSLIVLERVAETHWNHVEAMAEHGFNMVSYCLNFVNDRKCKFALQQAYSEIPVRGFKQWREITLHAVNSRQTVQDLRLAAEEHPLLKQLTENYLAQAEESESFLKNDDLKQLQEAAALVEQWRDRNDMFEVNNIHWQTFWESANPKFLSQIEALLSEFDYIEDKQTDNVEDSLRFYQQAKQRIHDFLQTYETQGGDRNQGVLDSFSAQEEFAHCQRHLISLPRYIRLQTDQIAPLDWKWLNETLCWRDLFEQLCGYQKLDVDSGFWLKLRDHLFHHQGFIKDAYAKLDSFFKKASEGVSDYDSIRSLVDEITNELPRHQLWLEKQRWQGKIPAFPEIKGLWENVLEGSVQSDKAKLLFCFNLLYLCNPIAKPSGPKFKQTLKAFAEYDENLTAWVLDHLKSRLEKTMQNAASSAAHSESELRRLSGLQKPRGTIRELVNAHLDYLLKAKLCWMMSPTSLANLISSQIFTKHSKEHSFPFDLVIFDEASQIQVLDGLLSMSFGHQVIIVGDKHQLPPTDFFTSFMNIDWADSQDFGISESLLNEFGESVFEEDKTQVMLMSHYRSETPDLIRFSNDEFYKGRLEIYPPAHVSGIGRKLHYVPNAIYSETAGQRNNPIEAGEVVKLIELHVREYPEKSLDVVTMNISQMELIDQQLQFFQPDEVRAFCVDESKFFLRNLETVQGDEMDRIILSLTYGKNSAGKFNASVLGPIVKSGGERRLNVAITRSRSGLTVVSSLKVADLETASAQSEGFKCLKKLLMNMEGQIRDFGITHRRFQRRRDGISNIVFCDSPFEEQVVEFLENEGYEIECQYGSGNFRIDIVVKEQGQNLLGIECDGRIYHSSLVARTRDRARQRILEKLGWRIHRVWSTTWWFYEQQEKEAIIVAINSARLARRTHYS